MKNIIRFFSLICLVLLFHLSFILPAEAVWVAINTGSYTMSGGVGYINPGATLNCYGYHEWPPYQTTTFTFSNGVNSYSATGANGTGKGGDFNLNMGPFASGTNYYMSSSNGGFINFSGPFTVGYPDAQLPYWPYINSASAAVYNKNVSVYLSCHDNVGVTGYYLQEAASAPAKPSAVASGWVAVASAAVYGETVGFTLSPAAGFKNVYVWFKDAAGNVSNNPDPGQTTSFTFQLILDTGPPTILSMSAQTPVSALATSITLTAADDIGVTGYYIMETASPPAPPAAAAAGWTAVTPAASFSKTVNNVALSKNTGIKHLYAWVKDAVGNVSARAHAAVQVNDTSPPTGSFSFVQPAGSVAGFINSSNITLNLITSDTVSDVTHCYVSNDNSSVPSSPDSGWVSLPPSYSSCSVNYTLTPGDGPKAVYVWFKDRADNIGAATNSPQTITVDSKLPIAGHEYAAGVWMPLGNPGFSEGQAANLSLCVENGTPYVLYCDGPNGNKATVQKFNGLNWVYVGTKAFSAAAVDNLTLKLNSAIPYAAYFDSTDSWRLIVKRFNGINWVTVGNNNVFPINNANHNHSFYIDNGLLYVSTFDGNTGGYHTAFKFDGTNWVNFGGTAFTSMPAYYPSLYVYNGTPYFAYSECYTGLKVCVKMFNGSAWTDVGATKFSSGGGYYDSLVVSQGVPYVAYTDDSLGGKVIVKKFDGATSWTDAGESYASPGAASYPTLFDYQNKIYLAFIDGTAGNKMTVKKLDGNSWVSIGEQFGSGSYLSFHVNEGIPYLAYSDSSCSGKATVMKLAETVNDGLIINNDARLTKTRGLKMKIFGTDWRKGSLGSGINQYCIKYGSVTAPLAGDTVWINMPTAFNNNSPATQEVDFNLPAGEGEGLKIFQLWFKDKAGNVSAVAQKSIKFDTIPPAEAIAGNVAVAGPHPELSITREIMLQLNAESGQDTIENYGYYDIKVSHYLLKDRNYTSQTAADMTALAGEAGWRTIAEPVTPYSDIVAYTLTGSGDGTKEIFAWYKDVANNMSVASKCITFLDTSIPHCSVVINGGDAWSNSTLVTLNLTAISATAVNAYYISPNSSIPSAVANGWRPVSPPVSNYAANIAYSLERSCGEKTVYVWFKSTSGIVSEVASDRIKLDFEPPAAGLEEVSVTTLAGPSQGSTTSGSGDATGNDARFYEPRGIVIDE